MNSELERLRADADRLKVELEAVWESAHEAAYELTGNETYLDWIRGQIDDVIVQEDGTIKDWNYSYYATDNYRMGNSYLWLYEHTGEEKYKSAAGIIREQMNRHPRLPQGSFWHGERDFNQMWLEYVYRYFLRRNGFP